VQVDPTLLDVLPSMLDGIAIEYAPEASAETATSPGLVQTTEALAYAIGANPQTADLVVAAISRPRAGSFSDQFFREWRDTFDQEVCSRAGEVAGNAEAEFDGRTVFIATCGNGGTVYHAYLERRALIASVFSLGEASLGEQLMGELRD
jgi:hypothetical protein